MKNIVYSILVLLSAVLLIGCTNVQGNEPVTEIHYTNGAELYFSLNGGADFINKDLRLEQFDIWDVQQNEDIKNIFFFYAFSYDEFLEKIEGNQESKFYYNPNLDALASDYSEEYFEENILLYYFAYESCISPNYIYSVTKEQNVLTLNVNRFEGMATALSSWEEKITVRKEDVKDVDEINVVVRTVSELQKSIMISIKDEYVRELYVKDFDITDFKGLKNLKAVTTFSWSLNVDIVFNKKPTDNEYNNVIEFLEKSPALKSLGYKGKDFIRVQFNGEYFDSIVGKTLTFKDFSAEQLKNDYNLSLKILDFKPFGFVTLELQEHGREKVEEMKKELAKMNLPFLDLDELFS